MWQALSADAVLYVPLTPPATLPRRVLIRAGRILPPAGILPRVGPVMTDLIYILGGLAVLGLYVLYALALRKI